MVIMTEPVCDPEDPKRPLKKDSKALSVPSETENGPDEAKLPSPQVVISDVDAIETRQKLSLSRSKVYDSSLPLEKCDMKLERKKSTSSQLSKSNAQFHKLFKDVPKDETLRESFTCALQKEILYQGKLYISDNWICFHSKVFGKDTKIVIPTIAVTVIKKTKTALLVPNALVVATVTDRFIFVSLLSRDSSYKLLKSVCSHLDSASTGHSPNPSSEHRFRGESAASFPLDFSVDFSEIDGLVQPRRKDIEEYSSTGSQTPESENSQDFQEEKNINPKSRASRILDNPLKVSEKVKFTEESVVHRRLFRGVNFQQVASLNGLLFFYAILVFLLIVSTFYMQSRILYLEERLSYLGSARDTTLKELSVEQGVWGWQMNANAICEELTANLAKLDQIQQNLQKLLRDEN
ncbi:GRAM domain-containing protein 2B isoform X2 [Bufo gargarizans]|uniref:GRAM domain-containing protein 2B isoform X2 n=1 Tax=Bufo gargarizans TaxID=30331 RepID=UPI001CF42578|nr:GRAM domain-containing protein 2B isoform X2 [Bufo gargarizans]